MDKNVSDESVTISLSCLTPPYLVRAFTCAVSHPGASSAAT